MKPCLTSEELEQFLTEDLAPAELAAGEAHLRACADCRSKLNDLTAAAPAATAALCRVSERRSAPAAAPPGFEVLCELGHGRTSVVYLAWQTSRDRFVALKMLAGGWPTEDEARRRFRAEI